jgi:hypothetical protein
MIRTGYNSLRILRPKKARKKMQQKMKIRKLLKMPKVKNQMLKRLFQKTMRRKDRPMRRRMAKVARMLRRPSRIRRRRKTKNKFRRTKGRLRRRRKLKLPMT